MAHKPLSYVVDDEKRLITLYENIKPTPMEEIMINRYLDKGYEHKIGVKKPGTSVVQMREELAKDPEALEKFNELYKLKVSKEELESGVKSGFHQATKFYTEWKKKNKNKKK